jgi:molybdopterin molybdotransferase
MLELKTVDEATEILGKIRPLGTEVVKVNEGLGRVAATDIISPEDLPPFDKAVMDGYALRAQDTFGASEANPVTLKVVGEVLMGEAPKISIQRNQAARISTGGVLPQGSNGVVMMEHTELRGDEVTMYKALAPWGNVLRSGGDVSKGEKVLSKGNFLRAQDVGILIGLGIMSLKVYCQPKVVIISTGDEIVRPEVKPKLGQIRDINSYTLEAQVKGIGCVPVRLGIVKDNFSELVEKIDQGLKFCDVVLISGGSSVGFRDITLKAIGSFANSQILAHGIAIKPGKPNIIARIQGKFVLGLPGHPVSSMISFSLIAQKILEGLMGCKTKPWQRRLTVQLTKPVVSSGRKEYVRVALRRKGDKLLAEPILGKSSMLSTMVKADGLISIPLGCGGMESGQSVEVMLF